MYVSAATLVATFVSTTSSIIWSVASCTYSSPSLKTVRVLALGMVHSHILHLPLLLIPYHTDLLALDE